MFIVADYAALTYLPTNSIMLASQDDNDNVNLTILLCQISAQYLNLISICLIYNNTKLHSHISERLFNEYSKVFFLFVYYIKINYLIPNSCLVHVSNYKFRVLDPYFHF